MSYEITDLVKLEKIDIEQLEEQYKEGMAVLIKEGEYANNIGEIILVDNPSNIYIIKITIRYINKRYNTAIRCYERNQFRIIDSKFLDIDDLINHTDESYLDKIRLLYESNQMSIAKNRCYFDINKCDGLIHNHKLYFLGSRILKYFPGVTLDNIIDSLEAQGVLEFSNSSRTKRINALHLKFYVIPLKYLEQ